MRELTHKEARTLLNKAWIDVLGDRKPMSFAEIGRVLNISPSTAHSVYKVAIRKLMAGLTDKQREEMHELLRDEEEVETLPEEVLVELDEQEYYWGGEVEE